MERRVDAEKTKQMGPVQEAKTARQTDANIGGGATREATTPRTQARSKAWAGDFSEAAALLQ